MGETCPGRQTKCGAINDAEPATNANPPAPKNLPNPQLGSAEHAGGEISSAKMNLFFNLKRYIYDRKTNAYECCRNQK